MSGQTNTMEPATRRSWKLQEFVAHRANVNCLAMGHKSSQVLATGGDDRKVNLWAIGRHSCLMSLSGHTTPVECVCFNHSEDLVCAGSQTGALKIWDLEAAKLLRTFTGHKGAIKCMDFHPYGDYLTTGACDSNIKLWDTRQRGCIVTYTAHRLPVNSLQFSPDGQWIASASEDGAVLVWDVRAGRVLRALEPHASAVSCVKFHPHEFLLASTAADRTMHFYDMENFQLVSKFRKEHTAVRHLLFSEDGRALLGAGSDGLHVVGWEPARVLDTAPAVWGPVHDLTVAHNQLIAGSFHSTYVVLWVVDLNKVYPFGGPAPASPPQVRDLSPFQKGHTIRKSFSKERPPKQVVHSGSVLDEKTVEESTSGTEAEEESGAVVANVTDYQEIFRPARALNRTPPPSTSLEPDIPPAPASRGASPGPGPAPARLAASLRDLAVSDYATHSAPSSLGEDAPHQQAQAHTQRQGHRTRADTFSRIPTSTKDYTSANEKAKSDYLIRRRTDTTEEGTYLALSSLNVRPIPDITCSVLPHSTLMRQHSYKEKSTTHYSGGGLRPSNSDVSLGPPSLGPRSHSFSRVATDTAKSKQMSGPGGGGREPRSGSPGVEIYERPPPPPRTAPRRPPDSEPEFVPIATDRPLGLDLDEFLPRGASAVAGVRGAVGEPSEQEVLGVMMRGHDSMMAVLVGRQRALQIFHSVRTNQSLKAALESTIALNDVAVLVDILNIMVHKPSLWNLDICLMLLPKILDLLQSKYESYMTCGCNVLRLLLRNFSSVIKSNVNSPVRSLGVDIPREERYNKCLQIHRLLLDIRAFLLKRQTMQGRLGATFRDLHTLIQQGLDG